MLLRPVVTMDAQHETCKDFVATCWFWRKARRQFSLPEFVNVYHSIWFVAGLFKSTQLLGHVCVWQSFEQNAGQILKNTIFTFCNPIWIQELIRRWFIVVFLRQEVRGRLKNSSFVALMCIYTHRPQGSHWPYRNLWEREYLQIPGIFTGPVSPTLATFSAFVKYASPSTQGSGLRI